MKTRELSTSRTVVNRPRSYLWDDREASFPMGELVRAACKNDEAMQLPELEKASIKAIEGAVVPSRHKTVYVISVDLAVTALLVGQVIAFCMITTAYVFARCLGG